MNEKDPKKKKSMSSLLTFLLVGFILIVIFNYGIDNYKNVEIYYNDFRTMLQNGEVEKVVITSDNLLLLKMIQNIRVKHYIQQMLMMID